MPLPPLPLPGPPPVPLDSLSVSSESVPSENSHPSATHSAIHNVGSWIAHWASLRGDQRAWADDHDQRTYQEAEEDLQKWVGWFKQAGLQPGDRVALWLGNRLATLEALLACARLGAIALPVNARLTAHEVAFQLDDCRPKIVLVEPRWEASAKEAAALTASPQMIRLVTLDDAHRQRLRAQTPDAEIYPVSPETPMILMYTSGTTGHPKGALLPHRKALYNCRNAQRFFDLSPSDHVFVAAPLFHSLALQILSLPALYCGGAVRLQEGFEAERAWRTIAEEGITLLGGVPTMHERLIACLDEGSPFTHPPETLRVLFSAGSAASIPLIEGCQRHGLVMQQGYGQTETSILTCQRPGDAEKKPGSVGQPVEFAEIRLIVPESLTGSSATWRDAEVGEVGEVVVRGPITMLGYWERPEATAETLREGWVLTGDLATRDEDFDLTLVGRAREMYISGGENVYPAEVEGVLLQHPAVAEAAVVARPDEQWGEVGIAFLVPASGQTVDQGELVEWLSARLAAFKRPRAIEIRESLPRTASGKIQKNRLERVSTRGDS